MKRLVKKIAVLSMIGMMQVGSAATVIEASPLYNDGPQRIVQLNDRHHHDNERRREHDRRQREENQRHEREMRRRHHESEREWHRRQERENQRHEHEMHNIAAFLLGIIVGSNRD